MERGREIARERERERERGMRRVWRDRRDVGMCHSNSQVRNLLVHRKDTRNRMKRARE